MQRSSQLEGSYLHSKTTEAMDYQIGGFCDFNISGGVVNENYDYFADGRLSFLHNTTDNKFDRSFSYDHAGRLIEALSGGLARNDSTAVPMYESFDYNAWNNTTFRYSQSWDNEFSDGAGYTNNRRSDWGYDADGRVATIDTRSYAYSNRRIAGLAPV